MNARNLDILARFDAGQTLQEIGDHYGITRERVRQITTKAGRRPRYEVTKARRNQDARQLRAVADAGRTYADMVRETGQPYSYIVQLCNERGIEVDRIPLGERIRRLKLAAKVSAGGSIRSSAETPADRYRIASLCQAEGITSKHGRWRDFSERERLTREGRAAGLSWVRIAASVSKAEGRNVAVAALYQWASRRCFTGDVRGHSIPPVRLKTLEKAPLVVPAEVTRRAGETIRQACLRLKGIAPASVIASSLGISRNAVIGHWWRGENGNRRTLAENRAGA